MFSLISCISFLKYTSIFVFQAAMQTLLRRKESTYLGLEAPGSSHRGIMFCKLAKKCSGCFSEEIWTLYCGQKMKRTMETAVHNKSACCITVLGKAHIHSCDVIINAESYTKISEQHMQHKCSINFLSLIDLPGPSLGLCTKGDHAHMVLQMKKSHLFHRK